MNEVINETDSSRSDVGCVERAAGTDGAEVVRLRAQLQDVAKGVSNIAVVVSGLIDRINELERIAIDRGELEEDERFRESGQFGVGA